MVKKITGWLAILLALLFLLPSFVPGAMSILAFLASLDVLVVALFSVSRGRRNHFNATLVIVVSGVLFINDGLRLWDPLPMPINFKPTMYGIFFMVVLACVIAASQLSRNKSTT